jgi:hypothetical protein
MGADRLLEPGRPHPLDDRGALTAGNYEAVEALELGRDADLAGFGAEAAQHQDVGLESPLDR